MRTTRVMPLLLLSGTKLVKTKKFKNPRYVGDPINAVRIFNEKEVDELIIFDISATRKKSGPNYDLLSDIASEAFMPMAYGGGITSPEQVERVLSLGFEKVVFNTSIFDAPHLIEDSARRFGSQSIVTCIDVKKHWNQKYCVYSHCGTIRKKISLDHLLSILDRLSIGEVIVNSISNDGCQKGYDINLLKIFSSRLRVPVVACGGAGSIKDFATAIKFGGASSVAAGSMFVFHGPHKAVLINYPKTLTLDATLP